MLTKLPCSSTFKNALLTGILAIASTAATQAQQITLFRTGVIVLPRYTTLADAIAATLPNDSLVLSPHTFKENGLSISHSIKITGTSDSSGTSTLDAISKSRVLLINAGDVTLENLTFINGKVLDGAGGGICNYGSGTLTILGNSSILNSSCSGIYALGGGIYSAGKLNLGGTTNVAQNQSSQDGGGVYAYSSVALFDHVSIKNNQTDGSGGGIFSVQNGALNVSGNVKIEHNTAGVAGGGAYGVGTISGAASLSYNTAEFGGGIAAFNDVLILEDSAKVNNNIAYTSGAGIWLNNCGMYGRSSFEINNNKIPAITGTLNFGGAIYNVNGTILINGGSITGNQSPVAAIYNTAAGTGKKVAIHSTHIYNPNADGTRQTEVFNSPSLPSSIIVFESDSCWWGSNDTTNLIKNKAGSSSGTIGSFVVLTWQLNNGLAISPLSSGFPLTADFRMNDGSKIDSLRLRSIRAVFKASNGSFTLPIATIDTDNYIRSLYIAPATTDSITVMAYVDADTFFSSKIGMFGLDIKPTALVNELTIYPNPSNGLLFVRNAPLNAIISVYGLDGRKLMQKTALQTQETIDLSFLVSGTYILQITNEQGLVSNAKIQKR